MRVHANGPGIDFGPGVLWLAKSQGPFVDEKTDKIVPGSLQELSSGTFYLRQVAKQLGALTYIRDNFCPGPPEPPITVNPY
jgi:hypothetical protein